MHQQPGARVPGTGAAESPLSGGEMGTEQSLTSRRPRGRAGTRNASSASPRDPPMPADTGLPVNEKHLYL